MTLLKPAVQINVALTRFDGEIFHQTVTLKHQQGKILLEKIAGIERIDYRLETENSNFSHLELQVVNFSLFVFYPNFPDETDQDRFRSEAINEYDQCRDETGTPKIQLRRLVSRLRTARVKCQFDHGSTQFALSLIKTDFSKSCYSTAGKQYPPSDCSEKPRRYRINFLCDPMETGCLSHGGITARIGPNSIPCICNKFGE